MSREIIEELRERSKDEAYRLSVSVHEAGHLLYARRAGALDVVYHGPCEHPDYPGEFGEAGVQPVFPTPGVQMDLRTMARWYCAGSMVKKALTQGFWEEGNDATDYRVFVGECVRLTNGEAAPQDINETWKAAQEDVERDLRNPALRRELWALAREIEKKIPW